MSASGPGDDHTSQVHAFLTSNQILSISTGDLVSFALKFDTIEAAYAQAASERLKPIRIACLATADPQWLLTFLKLHCYRSGLRPTFYWGGYDTVTADLLNPKSAAAQFQPDCVILLSDYRDFPEWPPLFASAAVLDAWVASARQQFQQQWAQAQRLASGTVFQSLPILPPCNALGNAAAAHPSSPALLLQRLNLELVEQRPAGVVLIDLTTLAGRLGTETWFDEAHYYLEKQLFSIAAARRTSLLIGRLLAAANGSVRKCLVLDLDDTLWGGAVGDDGVEGIILDPNHPLGEAYVEFQRYLKALRKRGVLLAVCSKNDEANAQAPFHSHPEMVLTLDDITCFVATWDDKATNLRRIATQLNLGLDALVFFDNSAAERELIQRELPEIETIPVPSDPAHYIRSLDQAHCFEWLALTPDDMERADSYRQTPARQPCKGAAVDYAAYLQSLEMRATIAWTAATDRARVTQLINKTNQFNVRTQRYSEAEIEQRLNNPELWRVLHIRLADRFTRYGIIAAVILARQGDAAFIDTWVISCRAFQRGVEELTANAIYAAARAWGCVTVTGEYLPTSKNGMISDLFTRLGFTTTADTPGHYCKLLSATSNHHTAITVTDPFPG